VRTLVDALIVAVIGGPAAGTWGVIGGLIIYTIGAS
jgi:hypothetical protein